ncbi:DUF1178 family protein [Jannaschia aquimarina]|uniref:DUF1178 family protein n=1 Tax=Jannaschia aquimarina TaxID=935700 RepID=A0A0D1EC13_9RHOB|nr:DUF1178 family protein [Jannaschia aquimarina]KIT14421.1 hypothetical protein jaqu_37090 [Jannaschia aquimarina]SNT29614.1 hypothetical protein SAMN05421775_11090 [Jannaschia aquimarina]
MIRYALKCAEGHDFESWFQSAEAYDTLAASGHLSCTICGGSDVRKALMAPKVAANDARSDAPSDATPPARPLSNPGAAPSNPAEAAIAALREKVEKTATYVGGAFAKEARAIHEGEKPDRPIWGEANATEARALIEDGVPVAPLPFRPKSKSN